MTTSLKKSNSYRPLILCLILLSAAILRVTAMNDRPLLGDEVGTALGVEEEYWYIMTHFSGWLTQPAHCLLTKLFTQLMWVGEFPMRLPSLLFGLGGIVAIYFLASRLFDERTGVVASLLLALSPYHLFYSQMARGYAMAATLSILSMICVLKLLETRKVSYAALYVLSTTTAIYCHLGSLGIIPAEFLVALMIANREGRGVGMLRSLVPTAVSVALIGLLVLALYYPAMNEMLSYRQRFSGNTDKGFSFGFVPLLLTAFMGGRGWSIYIFSAFAALGLVRGFRENVSGALLLLLWPVGVLLFYVLNDSRVYPWAYTRFLFITLPALIIVAAAGLVTAAKAAADRLDKMSKTPPAVPLCVMLSVFILLTSTKVIPIGRVELAHVLSHPIMARKRLSDRPERAGPRAGEYRNPGGPYPDSVHRRRRPCRKRHRI
jgi:uncharacterized membrane protein